MEKLDITRLPKKSSSQLDLSATLRLISSQWSTLIGNKNIKVGRKVVKECIAARNEYAHQSLRTVGDHRRALKIFKKLAGLVELKTLEKDIDYEGTTFQRLMEIGDDKFGLGQYAESIEFYSRALDKKLFNSAAYVKRAAAYYQLGKFDSTVEDAEAAIECDEQNGKAHKLLGKGFYKLEKLSAAIKAFEAAEKLCPGDMEVHKGIRDCNAELILQARVNNGVESKTLIDPTLLKMSKRLNINPEDIKLDADRIKNSDDAGSNLLKGHFHRDGSHGMKKDYQKAVHYYAKSAEQGNAEAMYNLGVLYSTGIGVSVKDMDVALELWLKAADLTPTVEVMPGLELPNVGVAESENALGVAYRDGSGVDIDYDRAVQWFMKSARKGCPPALNNMGCACLEGQGVKQSDKNAYDWFKKAAEAGEPSGQENYADLLLYGKGGPQDTKEAYRWYEEAANGGCVSATEKLENLKRTGRVSGVPSPLTVIDKLKEAASNGDIRGLFTLGQHYRYGTGGVIQDTIEARRLWVISAEKGDTLSQVQLGSLLEMEFYEYSEAFRWMNRAAAKNELAQFHLARFYCLGVGVEPDLKLAQKWYKRAISNGFSEDFVIEFDVEKKFKLGKDLWDFEFSNGLEHEGLSFEQRLNRYLRHRGEPPEMETLFDLFKKVMSRAPSSIRPDIPSSSEITLEDLKLSETAERAQGGSLTASKYLRGLKLFGDAVEAAENCNSELAVSFIYQAYQLSDYYRAVPNSLALSAVCRRRLEKAPKDAKAMFCYAKTNLLNQNLSWADIAEYLASCVETYPRISDFRILLGSSYAFMQRWTDAISQFERALKLDPKRYRIHYDLATSLRMVNDQAESLANYKAFLKCAEKDDRKFVEGCYGMALMSLPNFAQCRKYFKMGLDAENLWLPCFGPQQDSTCKIMAAMQSANLSASTNTCEACGKRKAQRRCTAKNKGGLSTNIFV
ncbi:hypothetical protein BKA69DRAFT_1039356 [Paraphysoderma sedebokerense]|nr:hypothetical protein BKA69DRAFT_1039356 [Paraphysoderma sedebokerense]